MKLTVNFKNILFYTLLFSIFSAAPVRAQDRNIVQKLIKQFLSAENDSTRGGSLIIIPAAGYAQESGFEYGIAGTYNFYLDKADLRSRTSNITLIGTLTTEKQKNVKLTSDIWTKNNDYHILSELRYRDWPFNFYGLGSDTWLADEDFIGQKLIRAKVDVEKRIAPNWYAGVNLNYEHFRFEDKEAGGVFDNDEVLGKLGGQYLALGISSLYDTRNNTTYSTAGSYVRLKYDYAPNFFGGENFTGSELEADLRTFKQLASSLTLAGQAVYRGTFGKHVPFYAYRELGGDMTMRGYYLGRYRDRNYAAAQAELRYRFMSRFGVVGFAGTGGTFSPEHTLRLVPSYGAGIRYFFSLEHNSTIRFDYAFGEKRPGEKRQKGFYLSISEAF